MCVWGHVVHVTHAIDDPTAEIVSPKYFITSEENESQDIWGLFHESCTNAAEGCHGQTPSGVIPSLFSFQLAGEHLSFHHPFICSISVLSLPGSRGADFWLFVARHRLDGMLTMSAKVCKMGFLGGWGGSTLSSDAKQNLSYCLVDVVLSHLWLESKYILWRFSITLNDLILLVLLRKYLWKKELLSAVLLPNEKEQNRSKHIKDKCNIVHSTLPWLFTYFLEMDNKSNNCS